MFIKPLAPIDPLPIARFYLASRQMVGRTVGLSDGQTNTETNRIHTPNLIIDDQKATITAPKQSIDTISFIKSDHNASKNHRAATNVMTTITAMSCLHLGPSSPDQLLRAFLMK